ncbi:aminotransferase class V-fold PLP-dependent enzyme [Peptostreptococcus equinus]|uniref:Aminotransferase class V-fold PLP-dependent enzyme n=1 Tax=Peptostreptococcus equinus TaxID=3003601 RepID=A0ABY7JPW3_9FIRM|nr:aminotransferase class V-fold PLP-dependent enzyme [Peptostreptococcus sp. CBA3647]WAW14010.1 aminotransferase class V-fold PLP-dependent enzyme [Peptostreptococcus sp. CBA3647]
MEFVASFSGGKDSILAIKKFIEQGNRLIGLIVSSKENGMSWSHNVDKEYYDNVAQILRCDIFFTYTDIDTYENNFEKALIYFKNIGAKACVFGDFNINKHIKWNNSRCINAGIEAIHPMKFMDSIDVINEFLKTDMQARIIKINEDYLPNLYIGKVIDKNLLDEIILQNPNTDPCGENGEYHTLVDIESIKKAFVSDIYLDNASTSYPKAPGISTRISDFINNESFSINRGTYMKSYNLSSKIIDIRERILKFVDAPDSSECIFTGSATESLNIIMNGLLDKRNTIVIDDRNHNSVWRIANNIKKQNSNKVIIWKANNEGKYEVEELINQIDKNTRYILLNIVDNVGGRNLIESTDNFKTLIDYCNSNNIFLIGDFSQAMCEYKFSMKELGFDAIIFSAHIGLMGSEGLGLLILNSSIKNNVKPLLFGGTGSKSADFNMPNTLPDRLEAGTLNHPAIFGLDAALEYISLIGIDKIIDKKNKLCNLAKDGLKDIDSIKVWGEGSFLCLSSKIIDDSDLAFNLDLQDGIMNRVGIQCSKMSHQAIDNFPKGCIRFTFGYFNNIYDVEDLIKAIKKYH